MGTEALGEAARAVQGPPGGLSLSQRPGTRWPLAEGSHLLASGRGQQLAGSEARELLSRVVLPSELSATGLGGIPKKKKPAEKKKKEKRGKRGGQRTAPAAGEGSPGGAGRVRGTEASKVDLE